MSDYMGDLSAMFGTYGTGGTDPANSPPLAKKDKGTLDLDDYLKLMVAMFQNQTIDNTADISDMMNNMVQMSVVEAISSISSLIEESTALNYAASLVGKQVTVGIVNNGQMIEIEGYVAATGTYNGQQVVFLKDKSGNPIDGYVPITSIMAIGWLSETGAADVVGDPEKPEEPEEPKVPDEIEDPENPDGGEGPGGDEGLGGAEGTEPPAGADGYGEPMGPGETDVPDVPGVPDVTDEAEAVAGAGAVSGADGYGGPMDAVES